MRIRRKKHLSERIKNTAENLYIADYDLKNVSDAVKDKRYFDFAEIFKNDKNTELEIGCGKGGFIIKKALKNPDINYFAVELLDNIIVMAAENAKKVKAANLKFFNCGAEYLPRYIKPHSVKTIYLNFSPPFNGKRYENRRLTNPRLIENYKEFLIQGGEIIQKTDDKEFFEYSKNQFSTNGFTVEDWSNRELPNDTLTEYETKFLNLNMPIYKLIATKKGEQ